MDFENKISDLGFIIDIPKNWVKLDPKNKNCFDAVAIDSFDGEVIFNIKMQVFLIEIPENMSYCVDLERVANNMGCIESVNFNNGITFTVWNESWLKSLWVFSISIAASAVTTPCS